MNSIKNSVLRHLRLRASIQTSVPDEYQYLLNRLTQMMCTSATPATDQIIDRVVGLVKKFHKIDASKVTETANFQKDLSLDSLDKVELVMALEQEFAIEIPEEEADKMTCCAEVAQYIASETKGKPADSF